MSCVALCQGPACSSFSRTRSISCNGEVLLTLCVLASPAPSTPTPTTWTSTTPCPSLARRHTPLPSTPSPRQSPRTTGSTSTSACCGGLRWQYTTCFDIDAFCGRWCKVSTGSLRLSCCSHPPHRTSCDLSAIRAVVPNSAPATMVAVAAPPRSSPVSTLRLLSSFQRPPSLWCSIGDVLSLSTHCFVTVNHFCTLTVYLVIEISPPPFSLPVVLQ